LGRDISLAVLFWQRVFLAPVVLRPTQFRRFSKALDEEGVEEQLARTIKLAFTLKLIAKTELIRVIVDSTVQEKAMAHPTDSKLLETARLKVVEAAKVGGIELKQTYTKESQLLG
jgi:IS5 family transposase